MKLSKIMKDWKSPNGPKRWSGAYGRKDGLTEFEAQGGKELKEASVDRRALSLINKRHIDGLEIAIRGIAIDLQDDGYDKKDIYKFLNNYVESEIKRVSKYLKI